MAPPTKPFDPIQFERLLNYQCTKKEIASFMYMSLDCLLKKVKDYYGDDATFKSVQAEKGGVNKVKLRIKQYRTAMRGNVSMQIWLGKQWLGQSDNPLQEFDDEQDYPEVVG